MGVRIALQCSETDSYLILSDDNAAARLLSRPGEAIYNDANGQVEGNSPFQIVWLPEPTRERYLQRLVTVAQQRGHRAVAPRIVFEGNVPADPADNLELADHLRGGDWPPAPTAPRAWLGEPVAIKGPTHAALARHSGGNVIIAGQRDEAALAMMAMSAVSLAAQCSPNDAQLWILDGTPADSPHAGFLERLADVVPHQVRFVAWREVGDAMAQLAAELKRRTDAGDTDAPGVYVLVNGLQRFRMLRRTEEDFGFSADDAGKPPAPDKQFAELLREGPVYGMHVLAWCDTTTNLERSLERQGLRCCSTRSGARWRSSAPMRCRRSRGSQRSGSSSAANPPTALPSACCRGQASCCGADARQRASDRVPRASKARLAPAPRPAGDDRRHGQKGQCSRCREHGQHANPEELRRSRLAEQQHRPLARRQIAQRHRPAQQRLEPTALAK
jgi:hypothetical protein